MADMTEPVIAEVKDIEYRADAVPLDQWEPADLSHFGIVAQVFIGTRGDNRADSFDVVVCSPSWLAAETAAGNWRAFNGAMLTGMNENVVPAAAVWLMARWSRDDFEQAVHQLCDICSPGPDWGSVASRIGRVIPWEYDYRYDAFVDKHYGEAYPRCP